MLTAEKIYKDILDLPLKEREKLFMAIARKGFEKDSYLHDEVFSDLNASPFTIKERPNTRNCRDNHKALCKNGSLKARKLGKSLIFNTDDLKTFKKKRQNLA